MSKFIIPDEDVPELTPIDLSATWSCIRCKKSGKKMKNTNSGPFWGCPRGGCEADIDPKPSLQNTDWNLELEKVKDPENGMLYFVEKYILKRKLRDFEIDFIKKNNEEKGCKEKEKKEVISHKHKKDC